VTVSRKRSDVATGRLAVCDASSLRGMQKGRGVDGDPSDTRQRQLLRQHEPAIPSV